MSRILLLALILCGAALAADDDHARLPVPLPQQQQEAIVRLYVTLKPDITRRGADLGAIALRLVEDAERAPDASLRYVTLREARDLAVRAGDATIAMRAIDGLVKHFRVPDHAQRNEVLLTIGRGVREPELAQRFVQASMAFLEPSIRADAFDHVEPLLSLTDRIARSISARRDGSQAVRTIGRWKSAIREHLWGGPAAERFAKDPGDQAAALATGRYYCFVKRDWVRGMQGLFRGSDPTLRAVAAIDLGAQRALATEKQGVHDSQVEFIDKLMLVAEEWRKAEPSQPEPHRPALLERSIYWLEQARPRVGDDAKARIDYLIDEAQTKIRARPPSLAKLTEAEASRVIQFRDRYYLFVPARRELAAARAHAAERQASLISIADEAANTFVLELMRDLGVPRLWLGAARGSEGTAWTWDDGTAMSYTNWADGEPKPGALGAVFGADGKWITAESGASPFLITWGGN